jgi:hypothetical protein
MGLDQATYTMTANLRFATQDLAILGKIVRKEHLAPYIGLLGYNNLGDEVLYEAHQKLFPSHKLIPYRKESVILERIAKFFHRPFCKHAILGGGTLINDGDIWLGKTEHLLEQGVRMFCIGTGAESPDFNGEERSKVILKRWLKALDKFEFVGVRGPRSKAILEKAGFKDAVVTGDTALALTEEKLKSGSSRGIVGLNYGDVAGNPMWGDSMQYRNELIKVIRAIISSGSKVILLPVWDKDLPSNRSLIEAVNHPNFTMVEAFDSYANFSRIVRQCDIFVGQKLHATILATMNRVPSIMIEYRPKCRDFMASLDLEKYVIKTSDFRFKTFMRTYEDLQRHHASVKSKAESRILEYKHLQFEHAKRLSSILAH